MVRVIIELNNTLLKSQIVIPTVVAIDGRDGLHVAVNTDSLEDVHDL